ncbi:hypothetical protein EJ04DRAFT_129689 [Polyplosphaeria fusca]|uniref:RING-type domain-containing protein n=1 Tax=Polyplosphaeria fusca TaxID=682080 RepID=A0A9P4V3X6_9PLEO|nr:hypothetical protein EJ04DRAFT_129689 [Polyplosphaeria fusca]
MTAQGVGIFTIEFPDPYTLSYYNDEFVTLGSNISFQYPITSNIQTLSAKDVERGNDPYGILYVPELRSDGCKEAEGSYVPTNATRLRNLPSGTDYALIGFLPWFSPQCVLEYFQSARTSPVKALLVYQPGTTNAPPPGNNDPSWSLGDGGNWEDANKFPVYALSSTSGTIVMTQLSLYSGNMTDAPHGDELASLFSPTDYVRLWATVNTQAGSQLPSLWVFLVIVLGLLLLIIFVTSSFMHIVQRRRRRDLQRRVVEGEVDLEALGVKRLTVPREYLEKLPLYTYSVPGGDLEKTVPQESPQPRDGAPETTEQATPAPGVPTAQNDATVSNQASSAFSQPTCPICLDDFISNETQVRELPCRHIFHPDCVDTFLLSNSSLCPMCKKSVLPGGYCPAKITNIMVRRERMIRRMRARGESESIEPTGQRTGGPVSLRDRLASTAFGRRVFGSPEQTQSGPNDIEMASPETAQPQASGALPAPAPATEITPAPDLAHTRSQAAPECTEPETRNRREWARQRALALVSNSRAPATDDEGNSGSRWRRGLRKVFPGFR